MNRWGAYLTTYNQAPLHIGHHVEFVRFRSNGSSMETCRKTPGHRNWHGSIGCLWLPVTFHSAPSNWPLMRRAHCPICRTTNRTDRLALNVDRLSSDVFVQWLRQFGIFVVNYNAPKCDFKNKIQIFYQHDLYDHTIPTSCRNLWTLPLCGGII